MFKKRKAQGLSVTTIILAVLGLIILVAIILMLTGKLGSFGEGVSSAASCENTCNAIGSDEFWDLYTAQECRDFNNDPSRATRWEYTALPGTYSDISEGHDCCCRKNK